MAYYLVRAKGQSGHCCRKRADSIEHLRDVMDGEDDPSSFEFTEFGRDAALHNWRLLVPAGEHYIPGVGSVPANVLPDLAKMMGCGVSEA